MKTVNSELLFFEETLAKLAHSTNFRHIKKGIVMRYFFKKILSLESENKPKEFELKDLANSPEFSVKKLSYLTDGESPYLILVLDSEVDQEKIENIKGEVGFSLSWGYIRRAAYYYVDRIDSINSGELSEGDRQKPNLKQYKYIQYKNGQGDWVLKITEGNVAPAIAALVRYEYCSSLLVPNNIPQLIQYEQKHLAYPMDLTSHLAGKYNLNIKQMQTITRLFYVRGMEELIKNKSLSPLTLFCSLRRNGVSEIEILTVQQGKALCATYEALSKTEDFRQKAITLDDMVLWFLCDSKIVAYIISSLIIYKFLSSNVEKQEPISSLLVHSRQEINKNIKQAVKELELLTQSKENNNTQPPPSFFFKIPIFKLDYELHEKEVTYER